MISILIFSLFVSGYMSPEYAMHGQFSEKSDVFSFGVMVLEIISGKKNSCSFESRRIDDLLSHVSIQILFVFLCILLLVPYIDPKNAN